MTGGAFVDLAEKLADAAAPIHRRYFRATTTIETKADASPVTAADREAETAMRAILDVEAPDHGILGEEYGNQRIDAEYVWVLDPLDGTKSFITGKPTFGTLIGLAHRGVPVLGVMDQPILNERWIGREGQATTFNGTPIATRPCGALERAWLSATSPGMFQGSNFIAFERLRERVWHTVYGSECLAYGLLAMGFLDLVVEADLKPYDFCALVPVVKGAGGAMTDWQGQPLSLESDGRVVAAGDAGLLDAALAALAG
jgi:inositol-phosphate phosphatase/L-galactose 1-phosphate phosphatase/histidinol-phosphatase